MMHYPLTGFSFHRDDPTIALLLEQAVRTLKALDLRVCGVLQLRSTADDACHCSDTDLLSVSSDRLFHISQPLGEGARGCRLDHGALADCGEHLAAEVAKGCDILILNRFGKAEAEGGGFRDLIAMTLEREIPILAGVRSEYAATWADFGQELASTVPASVEALHSWLETLPRPTRRRLSRTRCVDPHA